MLVDEDINASDLCAALANACPLETAEEWARLYKSGGYPKMVERVAWIGYGYVTGKYGATEIAQYEGLIRAFEDADLSCAAPRSYLDDMKAGRHFQEQPTTLFS